ncbi:MAG: anti-sigma B factor RsbW [Acidimicrobiales bacterium]
MPEPIEIDVPAKAEYLGLVRMMVSTLAASRRELDDERLEDLTLAVSEACSIAVAADDKPDRRLTVSCVEETDALILDVHDGRTRLDPDGPPAGMSEVDGGDVFPLELIRALVDSVELVHNAERDVLRLRMECKPSAQFADGL